jgi:hypothetical protein
MSGLARGTSQAMLSRVERDREHTMKELARVAFELALALGTYSACVGVVLSLRLLITRARAHRAQ